MHAKCVVVSHLTQVIVLSEGEIGYWGPVSEALSYFDSLGYSCPAHYSAAEFLAEVVRTRSLRISSISS